MTESAILTIPEESIGRPSVALTALQWAMLAHHAAGNGVSLTAEDVALICDGLADIIPAIQSMEAAIEAWIAEEYPQQHPPQPSADIIVLRPRFRPSPAGGDAA